jgi:tyrosinase
MPNGLRRRENVAGMGWNHPTLAAYRAAVRQMKSLPESDPRNWVRQAQIHRNWCPHGNWFFLPWHRKYILDFERICRNLSGNPNFALPYWDWTGTPRIPRPFWRGTLRNPRAADENDTLPPIWVGQGVINNVLGQTDFELFGSTRPFGQNNTNAGWQQAPGGKALLERTPHDQVHGWVGGDMGLVTRSPLDPIFWLHHCNIDRLWAEWNAPPRNRPNTSSPLWRNFTLRPFDTLVGDLQSVTQLGYTYDTLAQIQLAEVSELPPLLERARERFELMEPQAASLGQEVSFSVQTPQSAVPLAAEAVSAADVADEDGGRKVLALVRDVEPPEDKQVTVNVFLNCPYLSADTPLSDPHYVGNFTFFGVHEHGDEEAEGEHPMKLSFAFDLTETVAALRALEPDLESQLTVQLMPQPYEGRDVQPEDIKIEGVEIVYI